jgi:hypothetical protein
MYVTNDRNASLPGCAKRQGCIRERLFRRRSSLAVTGVLAVAAFAALARTRPGRRRPARGTPVADPVVDRDGAVDPPRSGGRSNRRDVDRGTPPLTGRRQDMSQHIESVTTDPRNSTREMLEEAFHAADPRPMETLVNEGGRRVDVPDREVHNDEHWRGFFPSDHVVSGLNRFLPLPAGFHKRFWTEGDSYLGETTDADGVVTGHNRLREVEHRGRPYALLTYTDLQYRPFYDLLLPIADDLAVGKAFVGRFPYGIEVLTFGLTRRYGFDFLAPADHAALWDEGTVPDPEALAGAWDVRLVSNAGLSAPLFEFQFETTEHGVDGQYEVLDTAGGDVRLDFDDDRMEMFDFSNWHDEIRQLTDDYMVGKYCQTETQLLPAPEDGSLGHLHAETEAGDERLCLYYVMNPRDEPIGEP